MMMADQDSDGTADSYELGGGVDDGISGSHIKGLIINYLHFFWPKLLEVFPQLSCVLIEVIESIPSDCSLTVSCRNLLHPSSKCHVERNRTTISPFSLFPNSTPGESRIPTPAKLSLAGVSSITRVSVRCSVCKSEVRVQPGPARFGHLNCAGGKTLLLGLEAASDSILVAHCVHCVHCLHEHRW